MLITMEAIMVRCRDCKHWKVAEEEREPFGYCYSPKWVGGYNVREKNLPLDAIHHEDDEDWGFTTGPNFGCVHGEVK